MMGSDVIARCQKKQIVASEVESRSEFGFKLASSLPDKTLLEILIRLPMKCATRYKVVCRHWCSLISSAYFLGMLNHLQRQRHFKYSPEQFTIVFEHRVKVTYSEGLCECMYPLVAISDPPELSQKYNIENVNLNFLHVGSDLHSMKYLRNRRFPFHVRASSHDLLLCSQFTAFYVVNLITKQWIALPSLHDSLGVPMNERRCSSVGQQPGLLCYRDEKHIGNADRWCRFKVVLLPVNMVFNRPKQIRKMRRSGFPKICSCEHNIQIYCSETRQWSEVRVDWYRPQWYYYWSYGHILAHDGMLHWLIGRNLVVFSGDANLNHVVKLPKDLVLHNCQSFFGVCVGYIRIASCIFEQGVGRVVYVWDLMKRSRRSWLLGHKVVLRGLDDESDNLDLIAFHPYNRDLVFFKYKLKIHLCNMRTKQLTLYRELKLGDDNSIPTSLKAVVHILHQWYPTPLYSPPQFKDSTPTN